MNFRNKKLGSSKKTGKKLDFSPHVLNVYLEVAPAIAPIPFINTNKSNFSPLPQINILKLPAEEEKN